MANEALKLALQRMEQALILIDESECGLEVGAHLDLAICRLHQLLANGDQSPTNDNLLPPHKDPEASTSKSSK